MYNGRQPQSASKGGNPRRQVIQQIIHNNGSGNILFSSGAVAQPAQGRRGQRVTSGGQGSQMMDYQTTPTRNQAMAKAYQAPMFKQQGEEIKNMYRNLKIQFNITQDENVRLRTRAQQMHLDLCRKEKDIENLTRQL